MPFTLSHAAAALPFRRARLVPSALVAGTFAPDFEYFIRLMPGGGFGHTLSGALLMDLPFGLGALWVFHRLVKIPLVCLLPNLVRERLTGQLGPFHFGPLRRLLHIAVSLLIGIATHLLWDSCTHPQYWITQHVRVLGHVHHYPVIGWESNDSILQLISSGGGLLVLALWCRWWFRRNAPGIDPAAIPKVHRWAILLVGCAVAALGALLRGYAGVGVPTTTFEFDDFAQQAVVTFFALCWWQLAMWGMLQPFRQIRRDAALHMHACCETVASSSE